MINDIKQLVINVNKKLAMLIKNHTHKKKVGHTSEFIFDIY